MFEEKLIKPYSRGEVKVQSEKVKVSGNFDMLIKNTPGIKKRLKTAITDGKRETPFTIDHAVRVYLWTEHGLATQKELGLSDRDFNLLIKTVESVEKTCGPEPRDLQIWKPHQILKFYKEIQRKSFIF